MNMKDSYLIPMAILVFTSHFTILDVINKTKEYGVDLQGEDLEKEIKRAISIYIKNGNIGLHEKGYIRVKQIDYRL